MFATWKSDKFSAISYENHLNITGSGFKAKESVRPSPPPPIFQQISELDVHVNLVVREISNSPSWQRNRQCSI